VGSFGELRGDLPHAAEAPRGIRSSERLEVGFAGQQNEGRRDEPIGRGTYPLLNDGGIDAATAPQAIDAGATVLVAGTAAFRGGPDCYAANIAALRGS